MRAWAFVALGIAILVAIAGGAIPGISDANDISAGQVAVTKIVASVFFVIFLVALFASTARKT